MKLHNVSIQLRGNTNVQQGSDTIKVGCSTYNGTKCSRVLYSLAQNWMQDDDGKLKHLRHISIVICIGENTVKKEQEFRVGETIEEHRMVTMAARYLRIYLSAWDHQMPLPGQARNSSAW